jgi:hypothetical protein
MISEEPLHTVAQSQVLNCEHGVLIKVKVKFSSCRPEEAFGDSEGQGFWIFHVFRRYESGKVFTFTHRPYLPQGVSWYSFLEAESTPGHMIPSVAKEKNPSDTNGVSIPQPSD